MIDMGQFPTADEPRTITLVATVEHKIKADKELETSNGRVSQCCIVNQVLRDQFPNVLIVVGLDGANVGDDDKWNLDEKGQELVMGYDSGDLDEDQLPYTFTITYKERRCGSN